MYSFSYVMLMYIIWSRFNSLKYKNTSITTTVQKTSHLTQLSSYWLYWTPLVLDFDPTLTHLVPVMMSDTFDPTYDVYVQISCQFLPDTLAYLRLYYYYRVVRAPSSSSGTTQVDDLCCIKCLSEDLYESWSAVKAFRLATTLSSSPSDIDKN